MNKQQNILIISVGLILALIIFGGNLFSLTGYQHVITVPGGGQRPFDYANANVGTIPIGITSTIIGSQLGSGSHSVCNNNDGELQVSNSFQVTGNSLVLNSDSRAIGGRSSGCQGNKIVANATVTNKKLIYVCSVTSYNEHGHGGEGSNPSCIIEVNGGQVVRVSLPYGDGITTERTINGEIVVNEASFVEMGAFSQHSNSDPQHLGYGTATLSVTFADIQGGGGNDGGDDGDSGSNTTIYIILGIGIIMFFVFKKRKSRK